MYLRNCLNVQKDTQIAHLGTPNYFERPEGTALLSKTTEAL